MSGLYSDSIQLKANAEAAEFFCPNTLRSRTQALFDSLLKLIAGQNEDKVALLLVSLSHKGKLLDRQQSLAVRQVLTARISRVLETHFSSISMLDESTLAVVFLTKNMRNERTLLSHAHNIVSVCSVEINAFQGTMSLEVKGGLSTPQWGSGKISSLVPFSRLALSKASPYDVQRYVGSGVKARRAF